MEIITGLEKEKATLLHQIQVNRSRLSNLVVSHEVAQIQTRVAELENEVSIIERRIKEQKGRIDSTDYQADKVHNEKIKVDIAETNKLNEAYKKRCEDMEGVNGKGGYKNHYLEHNRKAKLCLEIDLFLN